MNKRVELSQEQVDFIECALSGKNVLVDACIGSGKTTSIQRLCDQFSSEKKILYLTYNKLLKIDARSKIKKKNVKVMNYHGFAYSELKKIGVTTGISDLIQEFNKNIKRVNPFDVLIIDEYQDIEQEFAVMLEIIKASSPGIQIIAVGDMEQKIYDKTTLNVKKFIDSFLDQYERMRFTICFRLSEDIAKKLGRVWSKPINGINKNCKVEFMNTNDVVEFLSNQQPKDILCLGARRGALSDVLNELEERHAEVFNKKTVYASISDDDSIGSTKPKNSSAIFTTFDSSKGLERKICVVFDFTESYWHARISKPQQSFEILRNIFCVAASRGKEHIIFVITGESILSETTLSLKTEERHTFEDVKISGMFDFKYRENIEECFNLLDNKRIECTDKSIIHIDNSDGLIDLSPCIGMYQEAVFFDDYDIDKDIELLLLLNKNLKSFYTEEIKHSNIDKKILFYTFLDTKQDRYYKQVEPPFVNDRQRNAICNRLSKVFSNDENVQQYCRIDFSKRKDSETEFSAVGYADVVKNKTVYELKFVSELTHEHFLQCACYIIALNLEKGILWNTRNNDMYEISIPNKKTFLDAVVKTVTKQEITEYYGSMDTKSTEQIINNSIDLHTSKYFAVIDVETNYENETMSIGVVVAEKEGFSIVEKKYYVLYPEFEVGGVFSNALFSDDNYRETLFSRSEAISNIKSLLKKYNVVSVFAYNASFDYNHLPELSDFNWYDIMKLASNKNYNSYIPNTMPCYANGRLKKGYGVESIYTLMSGDSHYCEKHNALYDAIDELRIIELLGFKLEKYELLNSRKNPKQNIDYSQIVPGSKVKMKGKGIGTIKSIDDKLIKVMYNEIEYIYTRKHAFEKKYLKLI